MDLAPMQFCVPFTQIKRKKNRNTTQKNLYPTLENFMKEEFRCRGAKKVMHSLAKNLYSFQI